MVQVTQTSVEVVGRCQACDKQDGAVFEITFGRDDSNCTSTFRLCPKCAHYLLILLEESHVAERHRELECSND